MHDPVTPFADRHAAGQALAERLSTYVGRDDVTVLALPRGGVPVGYEVAQALAAPLAVFLVRKLGVPGHEELAFGAIAAGGVRVLNPEVVATVGLTDTAIEQVTARERAELQRREQAYQGDAPQRPMTDRVGILVDDGLATGATMMAAVAALRGQQPRAVVVAVPVAAAETAESFRAQVDDFVAVATPSPFYGVGAWYQDFAQTTDEEVRALLRAAAPAAAPREER